MFDDDACCDIDPLSHLDADGRYIFVHSQFGLARRFFDESLKFSFFHNYRLVWGLDIGASSGALPEEQRRSVEAQAGLEYLTKMFVSLSVELEYGIVRVRNLLLLAKGLLIDLEYLGVHSGRLSIY